MKRASSVRKGIVGRRRLDDLSDQLAGIDDFEEGMYMPSYAETSSHEYSSEPRWLSQS